MSNDVNRFESACYYFSYLLISPLQFIIATITLYYFIGPSSLAGLALILLFIPIQGWPIFSIEKRFLLESPYNKDYSLFITY